MERQFVTSQYYQRGVTSLALVLIILTVMAFTALLVARYAVQEQKTVANYYREQQAYEAAVAGIQFGIAYLSNNKLTILVDTNNDGLIDIFSNNLTTNVILDNGSVYSLTFNNPILYNFQRVNITSTGKSADGTAQRKLTLTLQFSPTLLHASAYSLVSKGSVTMNGSSLIKNPSSLTNIRSGSAVSINGNAQTLLGLLRISFPLNLGLDIKQNDNSVQSMSNANFFDNFFGASTSTVKSSANYTYQSDNNTDYSTALNNLRNSLIWIDMGNGSTAALSNNTIIGTTTEPVILVVNGNLSIAGNVIINGFVFATGNIQTSGNAIINGAMVSGGNVVDSGNFQLIYTTSIITKLQQLIGTFGFVPGSWNDALK